ncbi:MAG: ribosome small subunit-dependent GTPase A [Candidatus Sericytochromatia bacterium]
MQGLVINTQKNLYTVKYNNEQIICSITGKLLKQKENIKSLVVVGDIVDFDIVNNHNGLIKTISPRKTKFSRRGVGDDSRYEQIIASNIDQIIIVCSVHNPRYKLNGIDRYIVGAKSGGIEPIICFNKVDMIDIDEIKEDIDNYNKLGIKTICTSSFKNTGIDELKDILKDKISVLSGSSGVGKSSLTNSVFQYDIAKTNAISSMYGKGKHTTTSTYLYELPFGGMLLDTPGMREFSLIDTNESVDKSFKDILDLSANCKFKNCTHIHEPKCAVKLAVENNEISEQRYKSYIKLSKK